MACSSSLPAFARNENRMFCGNETSGDGSLPTSTELDVHVERIKLPKYTTTRDLLTVARSGCVSRTG